MVADRKKVEQLLKTARGHIDGILRMIEEDRYCIDIATQISAVFALLKKARQEVVAAHLSSCVKNATGDDLDQKIKEVIRLLEKIES